MVIVKKKVLLVISSDLINAGVPNVVMAIVRNLSNRFEFDIITYHNQVGQYDAEFEAFGGKIFRLSLLNYEEHKVLYPFRYFQIKRFLRNIFRQNDYDLIHCHNGVESGIFLKYAKKKEIPIRIAHAHGTYYRKGNNKILIWYNTLCKKLINQCATTKLACSTQAGTSLFMSDAFINVLNPVDVLSYIGLKKSEHSGCNLLQIGYFCNNKNQLFSIQLLKLLIDEKIDAKLTFIGFPQDKTYYEKMLRTIEKLDIKDNVCILPPDTDKTQIFLNADIVLMPSFTEGLPLVALESQCAHTAILLSEHISADANLGLATYAEYNNLPEWKNKIKHIYSNIESFNSININTDLIEKNKWCNRIGEFYDA